MIEELAGYELTLWSGACRHSQAHLIFISVLTLLVAPLAVMAAESDVPEDPSTWEWLEGRRDDVSRNVTGLGRAIDDWLAGEAVGEQENETYLRVGFNQLVGSFDGYHSKLKIGGSLDLPRLSERWKLILESDVDELNSLNENRLENTRSSVAAGSFRYEHTAESGWNFSHDVGLRAGLPVDAFYRVRAEHGVELNDLWAVGFRQSGWYYHSRGWGSDTRLYFSRELTPNSYLRLESELNYRKEYDTFEFGQFATIHQTLGAMETLSYQVGVLGLSHPNTRIDDYYVEARYRTAIYEDWLILEAAPQVVVSRDENWRPQPRFILNLELLFFDFD
ncbi:MAG: hypothetical protein WDZ76_04180 [Pseudohongiellaceae bacterium]